RRGAWLLRGLVPGRSQASSASRRGAGVQARLRRGTRRDVLTRRKPPVRRRLCVCVCVHSALRACWRRRRARNGWYVSTSRLERACKAAGFVIVVEAGGRTEQQSSITSPECYSDTTGVRA